MLNRWVGAKIVEMVGGTKIVEMVGGHKQLSSRKCKKGRLRQTSRKLTVFVYIIIFSYIISVYCN